MSSVQNAIQGSKLEPSQKQLVEETLQALLRSPVFSTAQRSRRFLNYVVEQHILGNAQSFKERTIGIEVFDRPLDYSTGEDPVVRVLAGDLRRRLERFYQLAEAKDLPVVITLPVGSYCPVFEFREKKEAGKVEAQEPPTLILPSEPATAPPSAVPPTQTPLEEPLRRGPNLWLKIAAACSILAVVLWAAFAILRPRHTPESLADKFWQPLFASHQPILIGLAKTITYHPSQKLYDDYAATHPGAFALEYQRMTDPLPLPPSASVSWSEMPQLTEYGVASGDVYASSQLSVLFAQKDKNSQLRIGTDYSFEDLRKFPAVLVGAFNNRWTIQVASGMPFFFDENKTHLLAIRERDGTHRMWLPEQVSRSDYAIVARVQSAETGQSVVIVGGIGAHGTQAATEFVCNEEYLNSGLKTLAAGWQSRNVVFVLKTTVTENVAGPPVVVASEVW